MRRNIGHHDGMESSPGIELLSGMESSPGLEESLSEQAGKSRHQSYVNAQVQHPLPHRNIIEEENNALNNDINTTKPSRSKGKKQAFAATEYMPSKHIDTHSRLPYSHMEKTTNLPSGDSGPNSPSHPVPPTASVTLLSSSSRPPPPPPAPPLEPAPAPGPVPAHPHTPGETPKETPEEPPVIVSPDTNASPPTSVPPPLGLETYIALPRSYAHAPEPPTPSELHDWPIIPQQTIESQDRKVEPQDVRTVQPPNDRILESPNIHPPHSPYPYDSEYTNDQDEPPSLRNIPRNRRKIPPRAPNFRKE